MHWLLIGLLALLVGCGGGSGTSSGRDEAAQAREAQIAATLKELTQLVRKYSVEQRQAPKNLDELVAKGYLSQVPEAPVGKKFAIDKNLQVYVSDR